MKNSLKPAILPWFTLGCGGLGLALRLWLYASADKKGLLAAGHPAATLLLILTALTLAALFLCVRPLKPIGKYTRLFPPGMGRAVGCAAGALGILAGAIHQYGSHGGFIHLFTLIVGVFAAICLGKTGRNRLQGSRPSFLLHTAVTVFFILYAVCNCRVWGAEPQLQEYFFSLLACIFLMLTGYYLSVLDTRKASRRWLVFSNQAALFFCCLSLNGENRMFYLGMLLWLALDLCSVEVHYPPMEEA